MVYFRFALLIAFSGGVESYFSEIFDLVTLLGPSGYENLPEKAKLNFKELAHQQGLKCEEHTVVTKDNYVLTVFHIPGDPGRPALLVPGFQDSSDTFILRGNVSFAFTLAAAGYDIWAINNRGNYYSRSHLYLDPDTDNDFWDFSYHEFGIYDIPACIDYALRKTDREDLVVFAHSHGCAAVLVMASELPKYNKKVELMVFLAPITNFAHAKGFPSHVFRLLPLVHAYQELTNQEEFLKRDSIPNRLLNAVCGSRKSFCYQYFGQHFWLKLLGVQDIDQEFYLTTRGHYPAGTSRKNLGHLTQNWLKGRFAKYDYGSTTNLQVYKACDPPLYDLSKVKSKVVIFYPSNDDLCTKDDIEILRRSLSNVIECYMIKKRTVKQGDLVWGATVDKYLYPILFQIVIDDTE